MSETILVVDDRTRVAQRVKDALGDMAAEVTEVGDARSAKQFLIQSEVALIIADIALGTDTTAGFTLCRQLREHERFSEIPVILVSEAINDDLIRAASECGAQGIVGWPFPLESMKKRLLALLSQSAIKARSSSAGNYGSGIAQAVSPGTRDSGGSGITQTKASPPPGAPLGGQNPVTQNPVTQNPVTQNPGTQNTGIKNTVPQPQAARPSTPPPPPAVDPASVTVEDKLKRAQHLLALVLHNLKTSNLLDLIELEDVPGIVVQMTRNVCGESSDPSQASKPQASAASVAGTPQSRSEEFSMDLDNLFGIKK